MFYVENDVIILPACSGLLLYTVTADSSFCASVCVCQACFCYIVIVTHVWWHLNEFGSSYGGGKVLDVSVCVCVLQPHMRDNRGGFMVKKYVRQRLCGSFSGLGVLKKPHFSKTND